MNSRGVDVFDRWTESETGRRRRAVGRRQLVREGDPGTLLPGVEVLQGDGLADRFAKDADVGRERLGLCLKKLRGRVEDNDDLLRALGRCDGEQPVDCASTPDVRRLSLCVAGRRCWEGGRLSGARGAGGS